MDQEFYKVVGQRINMYREKRGMTQEQLAEQVSLKRTSITNIERGNQKLLLHTLYDIASALRVEPTSLLPDIVPFNSPEVDKRTLKDVKDNELDWINLIRGEKRGDGNE